MKFLSIFILLAIALCNSVSASTPALEMLTPAPVDKAENALHNISINTKEPLLFIDSNLANYSDLLQIFKEFQQYNISFINSLLTKLASNTILSGLDLFVLRRTTLLYFNMNQKIFEFAKLYDLGGFKNFSPSDSTNKIVTEIKANLIWLSAHLLVLEQLEVMHELLYMKNNELRRILKNVMLDKKDTNGDTKRTLYQFIEMNKNIIEVGEGLKFSQQINLVRLINADLQTHLKQEDSALQILDTIVTNKVSTEIAQGKTTFAIKNFTSIDSFFDGIAHVTGSLSKVFGNVAGSIKWRKGYLYNNAKALSIASNNLYPMDILIEKSPFVLTDKFIPGHYGHIAVYLGTKKQLESINMWNHPDIVPYHDQISAGKVILEAVRPGVRLNSLENFLNIDELTIMTKVDGLTDPNLIFSEISQGMQQIGKAYDFNFDISTLDKIVCSELIYITFGNVHWPTISRFGRPTISPDDAAEILFQKNTKFKIKSFMVAKKKDKIDMVDKSYIAGDLNYELRASDGSPVQDENDKTNSYWKNETKCYNVSTYSNIRNNVVKRVCKTSYKEIQYEEREQI